MAGQMPEQSPPVTGLVGWLSSLVHSVPLRINLRTENTTTGFSSLRSKIPDLHGWRLNTGHVAPGEVQGVPGPDGI